MSWKQLYAEAVGHQGAMRDVARRSMLAVQDAQTANRLDMTTRLKADRAVPIYTLCAMLDTLRVEVPSECRVEVRRVGSSFITALH